MACRLLKNLGMEILQRNYTGSRGEIDIIARDGSTICFIEVKTRRRSPRSRPADAVTTRKKRKIVRTAEQYLRRIGSPPVVFRFDIIEIVFSGRKLLDTRYWTNEFSTFG